MNRTNIIGKFQNNRTAWSQSLTLLVALFSLTAFISLVKIRLDLIRYAKDYQSENTQKDDVSKIEGNEFASDELLIKFKDESKKKVKLSKEIKNAVGIGSVDEKLSRNNVKSVEKVVTENNSSDKDADIFSWYKVIIDTEKKNVKAHEPEAEKVKKLRESLLEDPEIETAEPNYTVYSLATPTPAKISKRISSSNDDAEENMSTGAISLSDSDLELVKDGSKTQTIGLRFAGINIPQGATILNAYVYFIVDEVQSEATSLTFHAQAIDSAAKFTTSSKNISSRKKTNASMSWNNVPAWNSRGSTVRTPSMGSVIQEVVSRPGWKSGNAMALIISGSGHRTAVSYNQSSSKAPRLAIEYQVAATTPTPTNMVQAQAQYPSDPFYWSNGSWGQNYSDLYGIKKVNPGIAWTDSQSFTTQIVVAVLDSGIDYTHPDLMNNIWVNSREIPDNGIDDDRNGYVDDYYGMNFISNGDTMDRNGHGTHVAGTLAAVGNNGIGVVGVGFNSRIKLMAVKALNDQGYGTDTSFAQALVYAADMGARVSNNSWGTVYLEAPQIIKDALRYEYNKGMVIVAAAGNNAEADALNFLPAASDYAITVSASNPNDQIAWFSSRGVKIDVAAPGQDILSTMAKNTRKCELAIVGVNYCRLNGTSMAAPHVAGLAAAILSRNPGLTNEQVRQKLRMGSDDLGNSGKDTLFGYGRINMDKTLKTPTPLAPVLKSPVSNSVFSQGTITFSGTASGTGLTSYSIEAAKESFRYIWEPNYWYYFPSFRTSGNWFTVVGNKTNPVSNGVLGSMNVSSLAKGYYTFRLVASDNQGRKYYSQIYDVKIDPCLNCADTTGVFRPSNGAIYLKNSNTTGYADIQINYGLAGDYPIAGDWDGNGTDTIGVYRNGTFYLRNSNTVGFADKVFAFGSPGDQPVAGDWDGDGVDTIGVFKTSTATFALRNSNTAGATDISFTLGNPGDVGISGDWNGDGVDTTGVFRPSNGVIYLINNPVSGFAEISINYGITGDFPVAGDWNRDGIDTIGVYRNGSFYLRNSNTIGFADIVFALGNPGDIPITGNWDGKP